MGRNKKTKEPEKYQEIKEIKEPEKDQETKETEIKDQETKETEIKTDISDVINSVNQENKPEISENFESVINEISEITENRGRKKMTDEEKAQRKEERERKKLQEKEDLQKQETLKDFNNVSLFISKGIGNALLNGYLYLGEKLNFLDATLPISMEESEIFSNSLQNILNKYLPEGFKENNDLVNMLLILSSVTITHIKIKKKEPQNLYVVPKSNEKVKDEKKENKVIDI